MSVVRTTKRVRTRRLRAQQLSVIREAQYIIDQAARRKTCIVTLGPLLFFSTDTGDAWVLDPEDSSARCLAKDGQPLPHGMTETPERFAIEWTSYYRIDAEVMTFLERSGGARSVIGYPVMEIQRAIQRMQAAQ